MAEPRVPNESLVFEEGMMWLDGVPYSGVSYFLNDEGELVGETEYRDGLKWGVSRSWYLPDVPFQESHLFLGTRHGKFREWHRNGQLKEEADYELGFALRRTRWDEDGQVLERYEFRPTDPDYKNLEKYREIYRSELEAEARRLT